MRVNVCMGLPVRLRSLHARPVFARRTTDILRRAIYYNTNRMPINKKVSSYVPQTDRMSAFVSKEIRQVRDPGRACVFFCLLV